MLLSPFSPGFGHHAGGVAQTQYLDQLHPTGAHSLHAPQTHHNLFQPAPVAASLLVGQQLSWPTHAQQSQQQQLQVPDFTQRASSGGAPLYPLIASPKQFTLPLVGQAQLDVPIKNVALTQLQQGSVLPPFDTSAVGVVSSQQPQQQQQHLSSPLSKEHKNQLAERLLHQRIVVDQHTAGALLLESYSQSRVFVLRNFPGAVQPAFDSIAALLRNPPRGSGLAYSFNVLRCNGCSS